MPAFENLVIVVAVAFFAPVVLGLFPGDSRHTAVAAFLQAVSLPFIVAATAIGMDLGLIDARRQRRLDRSGSAVGPDVFPLAGLVALRNASAAAATVRQVHRGGIDVPDPVHL
jgi:hypothetical protein